jgi:hypothetical protein
MIIPFAILKLHQIIFSNNILDVNFLMKLPVLRLVCLIRKEEGSSGKFPKVGFMGKWLWLILD